MSEILSSEQKNAINQRIISIVNIASKCGQAISLKAISLMLAQKLSEKEILSIIQNNLNFATRFSLEKGFVVQKGYEHLFSERKARAKVSREYFQVAELFFMKLARKNSSVKLAAVCGSVAYGSAKASDDIDLFIIAGKNRLWLVFFKALLLARIYNMKAALAGRKADFCLSYMQDEFEFEREMQRKTPLLAREFLSITVTFGRDFYRTLLVKAKWMRGIFPRLTAQKLSENEQNDFSYNHQESIVPLQDALNMMVYVFLGRYLMFKAFIRNLGFRKHLRNNEVFEAKITKGSCVYNSMRYKELEKMYKL